MGFLWTTVSVKNLDASLEFYQRVVGLPLGRQIATPHMKIAFLGEGETQVELIERPGQVPAPYPEDISLGFAVASVGAKIAELERQGIKIHSGPFQPGPQITYFYVQDPDGLLIQFVESHG